MITEIYHDNAQQLLQPAGSGQPWFRNHSFCCLCQCMSVTDHPHPKYIHRWNTILNNIWIHLVLSRFNLLDTCIITDIRSFKHAITLGHRWPTVGPPLKHFTDITYSWVGNALGLCMKWQLVSMQLNQILQKSKQMSGAPTWVWFPSSNSGLCSPIYLSHIKTDCRFRISKVYLPRIQSFIILPTKLNEPQPFIYVMFSGKMPNFCHSPCTGHWCQWWGAPKIQIKWRS
jgi:hypothetical protein